MIICKTPRELGIMREAGRIVDLTHVEMNKNIKPGFSTNGLDHIAESFIDKQGAI
ncbi:type I methionyl aminopeptidase, partial [Bacillus velezensis]